MTTRRTKLTGKEAWYTPSPYIEAAAGVMGAIDLDPARFEDAFLRFGPVLRTHAVALRRVA